MSVGAWPNAWFPNLPGSGTAQPPACRAQKFSARGTRHMRALTHGAAPRHGPLPRRKVLRSLRQADLGAIRRICFRTHVCVCFDGRFARPEQANGPTGRGRRMTRRDRFAPRQNRPERNPAERPGRDVLARRANRGPGCNAAVRPHGRMRDGPEGRSPLRHAKPSWGGWRQSFAVVAKAKAWIIQSRPSPLWTRSLAGYHYVQLSGVANSTFRLSFVSCVP